MSGVSQPSGSYADSIVATVRQPLLLVDAALRVVMANDAFCRAFGRPADAITGQPVEDADGGTWAVRDLREQLAHLQDGDKALDGFEITRADGTAWLLNARPLAQAGGPERMLLVAFDDVTERRRLERALDVTMTELRRSNQELEAFASIASHDLQEPLRKIVAFGERLETVSEGSLPERGRDYLARMTGAAGRMQRLITDLLQLSRISHQREAWEPVALNQIVSAVLVDLEEALGRSGGRVDVGPLPVVQADATQMRQLFQNLIANAIKFRGTDPPVIRITATPVHDLGLGAGGQALSRTFSRIVVADNGIGFDPKHADRIFRPFERLHARDAYEGTGIGLALCQRIVRRHGGAIRAESTPGAGTRIILHLVPVEGASP